MDGGLNSLWPKIGGDGFHESLGKNSGKNPPFKIGVLDVTPVRQMDEPRSCSVKHAVQLIQVNLFFVQLIKRHSGWQ